MPAATLRRHARRAQRRVLLIVPLVGAVLALYRLRVTLFGVDVPVRIGAAVALVILGWALARSLGNALQPRVLARMDQGTAGVTGFLVRLVTLVVAVLVSLRLAGLSPGTLLAGASVTAVVLALAAQQTFGNVLAGLVLLSARPFKVGERVRFAGFGMDVEGTVAALGLLYVTMTDGEDLVLVPNNTALTMSVRPRRNPASLDLRARVPLDTDPETVERKVTEGVTVATRESPDVEFEALEADEVVLRIRATPRDRSQGGQLARDVVAAVATLRRNGTR